MAITGRLLLSLVGFVGAGSLVVPMTISGFSRVDSKTQNSVMSDAPSSEIIDQISEESEPKDTALSPLNKDRHCIQLSLGLPDDWKGLFACPIGDSEYDSAIFYLNISGKNEVRAGVTISNIEITNLKDSLGNYKFTLTKTNSLDPISWTVPSSQIDDKSVQAVFVLGISEITDSLKVKVSECKFSGSQILECAPSFD